MLVSHRFMKYRFKVIFFMLLATAVFFSFAALCEAFLPKDSAKWLDNLIGSTGLIYAIYMLLAVKELIFPSDKNTTPPSAE